MSLTRTLVRPSGDHRPRLGRITATAAVLGLAVLSGPARAHAFSSLQEPPPTTAPATPAPAAAAAPEEPAPRAEVTLSCAAGDDAAGEGRVVTGFTTTVGPGQTAVLYLSTFDPPSGGFVTTPVAVGAIVPAVVVMPDGPTQLAWQVVGVELGPNPLDRVVDTCSGVVMARSGVDSSGLALVAALLVAAGLLLGHISTRRRSGLA